MNYKSNISHLKVTIQYKISDSSKLFLLTVDYKELYEASHLEGSNVCIDNFVENIVKQQNKGYDVIIVIKDVKVLYCDKNDPIND